MAPRRRGAHNGRGQTKTGIMFDNLRRVTRVIFYTGSFFFFLAAVLQFFRGAGLSGEYLLGGALMAFAPALLDYLDDRFGPG